MNVREIMSHDVELIDPNATICDAARLMRDDNVGALPVGENDRLVGMVTDRDIVMRAIAEDRPAGSTSVRDVMSKRIYYCFEDDDIDEAADIMAKHQVRRLAVLNRDKRLVGIVALADLGRGGHDAAKKALKDISQPSEHPHH